MEIKRTILPPMMPNFAFYAAKPGLRQEGLKVEKNQIPIKDFTREQAEEYGELMKETFLKHWESKQQ